MGFIWQIFRVIAFSTYVGVLGKRCYNFSNLCNQGLAVRYCTNMCKLYEKTVLCGEKPVDYEIIVRKGLLVFTTYVLL